MATTTKTTTTTEKQKGWASERARALAGDPNAAKRFASLAAVLLDAEAQGERVLSFAELNKRAGLRRGERGDPVRAWASGLRKMRQLVPVGGWQVDAERGAVVLVHDDQ
jgi:hypothetical protein